MPRRVRRPGIFAAVMRFFWMPRQISIRPAYAVAAAVAVLALFVALENQTTTVRTTEAPRLFVQFRLEADAMNVQLAGSFTNWEPAYQLHQMSPGVWTIAVPLPQGVHDYAFIVDGQRWVADPYAPRINDGFGGTNSRLTLLLPDTHAPMKCAETHRSVSRRACHRCARGDLCAGIVCRRLSGSTRV